jgi:cell wall-associated NlpC family hydrolase
MRRIPFAQPEKKEVIAHLINLMRYLLLFSLLVGCGGGPERTDSGAVYYGAERVNLANTRRVRQLLNAQLREWHGVRYREGGLSKRGVDCSGFVYLTYLQRFGIRLPRTTGGQAAIGTPVSRNQLRPGDLVFFKTAWKTRHVGIYYGNRQFIHASTSNGVMASSLDNPYWSRAYWKAVRVGD